MDIDAIEKTEQFQIAVSSVKDEDIEPIKEVIHGVQQSDYDLKKSIVFVSWLNPICKSCGNKNSGELVKCKGCFLAFYCNKNCQRKHWPAHKHRCLYKK